MTDTYWRNDFVFGTYNTLPPLQDTLPGVYEGYRNFHTSFALVEADAAFGHIAVAVARDWGGSLALLDAGGNFAESARS